MDELNQPSQPAAWPSCVKVTPSDIDLGTQVQGTRFPDKKFTIKNSCSGLRNFSISETVDWITSVTPAAAELNSTESVTITVSGRFPDEAGEFEGEIKIIARPEGAVTFIRIHGVAKPKLLISPTTINLGIQPTGGTFSGSFTVRNIGEGALTGTVSANRTVITLLEPESFSIEDVATINFRGKFPTVPGNFNTRITVNSDGGNGAVNVVAEIRQSPVLALQPPEPEIPKRIPTGSTFNSSFTVRNIGGGVLTGTVSANRTLITLLEPEEFTIEDVAKITFQVRFPTTPGPFSTIIDVNTNGGNGQILIQCDVIWRLMVSPNEIRLEPAVAGTRFTESITIENIGGGELDVNVEIQNGKWVDDLAAEEKHFVLEGDTKIKLINISGYVPPIDEDFPATIAITSNGGSENVVIDGMVLRELYWGEDTGGLKGQLLPLNFYIGHLGNGISDCVTPCFDPKSFDRVEPESTYVFWTLWGPGTIYNTENAALNWGKKQADYFLNRLEKGEWSDKGCKDEKGYHKEWLDEGGQNKFGGDTIFVDIEHPDNPAFRKDCWGEGEISVEQRKRNRKVMEGFLAGVRARYPQANLGIYAANDPENRGSFLDIIGKPDYEFPSSVTFPDSEEAIAIGHIVIWVAYWPENLSPKYDPTDPEHFNINDVANIWYKEARTINIGQYYPVIWQFYSFAADVTEQNPAEVFKPNLSLYPDVPPDYWAKPWIEKAYKTGIMPEYSVYPFRFGPEEPVLRQDAAVYVLKTKYGKDLVPPPATGKVFDDVPIDHPYASWIEKLKVDGFTSGRSTNPPLYCPAEKLTRAEMAVLKVRLTHGTTFNPPNATGKVFQDVPAAHWGAKWIEQLYRDGLAVGSSSNPPLYRPEDAVTRAEMAAFLMKTIETRPGCGASLQLIASLLQAVSRYGEKRKQNKT